MVRSLGGIQCLSQRGHVEEDNVDQIFAEFDLRDALMNDPSFTALLDLKKDDVHMKLRCLLTNPNFSSEELEKYYPPICWDSEKSLDFLCLLSERLSWRPPEDSPQYRAAESRRQSLRRELESRKQQIFNGKSIDDIDQNLTQESQYDDESVKDLLRFVRNKWWHRLQLPEQFVGGDGGRLFYDYLHGLFPDLLMVSYRAASGICAKESWFANFR
ncbi:serine/threonine-protein kinase/endoribonuclease IRE1b isoform X2 [Eucalyptus grandis]|uniref:serine/threonine-protein kinase/endoribonuclease IRE1b isoform X2 n=1 Tax=Eucalyptus grandis TaxID=71139 RepID=UPI00192F082E|nr:serine/threonine-protein kinase/endoribonuclease IRE1b isoform X2 [Eucalyptus grandis]